MIFLFFLVGRSTLESERQSGGYACDSMSVEGERREELQFRSRKSRCCCCCFWVIRVNTFYRITWRSSLDICQTLTLMPYDDALINCRPTCWTCLHLWQVDTRYRDKEKCSHHMQCHLEHRRLFYF